MVHRVPDDMIMNVFSRLPAKSLHRFRCASHSWLTLICPHLITASKIKHHQKHLFLFSKNHCSILSCYELTFGYDAEAAMVDIEYPFKSVPDSFEVLTSCDGWFLLGFDDQGTRKLLLFNPLTGKGREFQSCVKYISSEDYYGILYDHSAKDYIVVYVATGIGKLKKPTYIPFFALFSFKTNSWMKTRVLPSWVAHILGHAVSLNGALHWASRSRAGKNGILRFSLRDEFVEMPPPLKEWLPIHHNQLYDYDLAVLRGNLCVNVLMGSYKFVVMEMEQYGVKDSWIQACCIKYSTEKDLQPLAFTKNGELVVRRNRDVCIYNDDDKIIKTLWDIQGIEGLRMATYTADYAADDTSVSLNCDCLPERRHHQASLPSRTKIIEEKLD